MVIIKRVEALLNTESHNDVIRKAAISYFGSVISDNNYDRLKELAEYGGTTWDARSEAVNQLGKYAKKKPKSVKEIKIIDNWARLKTINMCVR